VDGLAGARFAVMAETQRPDRREQGVGAERTTLESFLDDYRDIVVRKVSGLSDSGLDLYPLTCCFGGAAGNRTQHRNRADLRKRWIGRRGTTRKYARRPAHTREVYLTADAQYLLFERIRSLNAPGSRVAVEAFTNEFFSADSFARRGEQTEPYRNVAIKLGGKDITESGNLLYEGERTEVVDWLRAHRWSVTSATSADDLMAASNRAAPAGLDAAIPESVFVEARLH
jgi:hypothetical protein